MDIEGSEWQALASLPTTVLRQFVQIVIELHDLDKIEDVGGITKTSVLAKLAETHDVVHVHANNHNGLAVVGNVAIPPVLEVTYLRKGS